MYAYTVEPLYIESGSDVIAADVYRPKQIESRAVIIMAHGFAALRQFKLIHFAQRFAQAGYVVVLFDYRYWGGVQDNLESLFLLVDSLMIGVRLLVRSQPKSN